MSRNSEALHKLIMMSGRHIFRVCRSLEQMMSTNRSFVWFIRMLPSSNRGCRSRTKCAAPMSRCLVWVGTWITISGMMVRTMTPFSLRLTLVLSHGSARPDNEQYRGAVPNIAPITPYRSRRPHIVGQNRIQIDVLILKIEVSLPTLLFSSTFVFPSVPFLLTLQQEAAGLC